MDTCGRGAAGSAAVDGAGIVVAVAGQVNLGDTGDPVLVTLNPPFPPARDKIISQLRAEHPIPSPEAVNAAHRLPTIQGRNAIWFCGAYQGYGFHEDGFRAGLEAANGVLGRAETPLSAAPAQMAAVATWWQWLARFVVLAFCHAFVRAGMLLIGEAGGAELAFGREQPTASSTAAAPLAASLRVNRPAFYWKVATRADLGLADAYIDGDFEPVGPAASDHGLLAFLLVSLSATNSSRQGPACCVLPPPRSADTSWRLLLLLPLLQLLIANRDLGPWIVAERRLARGWWSPTFVTATAASAIGYARHLLRANTLTNARRNIARHYDLSNDLFALFLDETMTYSCAIFQARVEKHHHVLEIGFGWGSMAIELVRTTGCQYTGITLSHEQLKYAKQRVLAAGLSDHITLLLCDYRSLPGHGGYDRIISCEMLEAVGHEYLGQFFGHCDRLLAMQGLLVVQVITTPEERYEEYRRSTDFIKQYIFPGCCVPSFAALTAAMASSSTFSVEDVENIGPHYATTLLRWRDNFLAHSRDVVKMGFNDKFACGTITLSTALLDF
eukprot:SM000089S23806  [mRNA]  locus=s89:24895:31296:- [translate_table: standard]